MGNEQGHPIEGLMKTAMESMKEMVDVNTILGDPVETTDGSIILPVSRVSIGFAAGGSDHDAQQRSKGDGSGSYPFGGGSGAGISVNPVAFLVVGQGKVRLMPVDANAIFDRLIDLAPQVLDKLSKNPAPSHERHTPNMPPPM